MTGIDRHTIVRQRSGKPAAKDRVSLYVATPSNSGLACWQLPAHFTLSRDATDATSGQFASRHRRRSGSIELVTRRQVVRHADHRRPNEQDIAEYLMRI